jgi:CBS domain containing-hemolysin-like protein
MEENQNPLPWYRRAWCALRERVLGTIEEIELREAVDELIEECTTESGAPTAERILLDNILKLRECTVADCMVPRADIVAVDADGGIDQVIERMTEHAHSRIPAYRGTLDETVGMVHMKDVLAHLAEKKTCTVASLLRPVLFVAPSMPASKLLVQMRTTRQHMAMVVDEFGGIDGLVTIEDLVEEVVGEIEDEHDEPETPDIVARPDGTLLINGRLPIAEFEERAGQILTSDERETIDTLGGYVFHLAGHVPRIGEIVPGPGRLLFEVLATGQNRIERLRVRGIHRTTAE